MIERWGRLAAAGLIWACAAGVAVGAERPNIVCIVADDLGMGDVRALNPERGKIPTPHLDKLVAQGMRFTDAHSGSSVCTPTRYGLLTGRYAWRTRLQSGVLDGYDEPLVAADRWTWPAMLRKAGYRTACIGKWHLGYTVDRGPARGAGKFAGAPVGAVTTDGPTTRGFDLFYGFHHARMMGSLFENDRVARTIEPVDMLPELARRAEAYIMESAAADRPFFLYLPLSSPHTPIVPTAANRGKTGLGDYADFVVDTDDAVGRVLAALDEAGVSGNTLVVFTSDNGCSPQAGIGALEKKGHFPSGPYRGCKADIWEGGHRVPFVARLPGKIEAGSSSSALVCLTDLPATCADLLKLELPPNACEDGFSFLPAWLGTGPAPRTGVVHHSISGRFAVREGNLKLCLCRGSGGWSKGETAGECQLYDLAADPAEKTNLAAARPEEVARLTKLLEEWIARGRSTPGPDQKNDGAVKWRKKEGAADKIAD